MDAKVPGEVALLLHGPKKLFGHASLLGVRCRMPVAGVVVVWHHIANKQNPKPKQTQYDMTMIKYLNDAAAKTHALEHLVEAQGDHQRLDGARVFGRAKGDADDHWVNHNAKLKNLQNQSTLLVKKVSISMSLRFLCS